MRTIFLPICGTTPKVSRPCRGLRQYPVVLWPSVNLTTFFFLSRFSLKLYLYWRITSHPSSLPSPNKDLVWRSTSCCSISSSNNRVKLGRTLGELSSSDCQKQRPFITSQAAIECSKWLPTFFDLPARPTKIDQKWKFLTSMFFVRFGWNLVGG